MTPAVNQIRWSPAIFDATVAQGLAERQVVLEGYSPFKASNLADPVLTAIAEAHGATAAQVIVRLARRALLRGHPEVGPPGADREQRRRGDDHPERRRGAQNRRAGLISGGLG